MKLEPDHARVLQQQTMVSAALNQIQEDTRLSDLEMCNVLAGWLRSRLIRLERVERLARTGYEPDPVVERIAQGGLT